MYKFQTLQSAMNFAERGIKPMGVILGDQLFWVVTFAQMEKLLAAGYELAA